MTLLLHQKMSPCFWCSVNLEHRHSNLCNFISSSHWIQAILSRGRDSSSKLAETAIPSGQSCVFDVVCAYTTDSLVLWINILLENVLHEWKVFPVQIHTPDVIPTMTVIKYFIMKTLKSGHGLEVIPYGQLIWKPLHSLSYQVTIHLSRKACS